MKKLLSLALALALCLGLTVPAYAAGDFTIEDGVLTSYNGSGSSVVIPDGVTAIGDSAFGNCETMTSVTIPDSVSFIGTNAFFNCINLTDIDIPASVTDFGPWAFVGTPWLEQLGEFPVVNGCLLVGPLGKTSVVIPDGVTTICGQAFLNYNRANEGDNALKSVVIPDSVTKIGEHTFYYCDSLTDLTIPDSVTDIGGWAFMGCSSLTSFTIPSGMRSIEQMTFAWCSSLTSLTIPSNITEIGEDAFYQSGLTNVTILNGVTSIGHGAFSYCNNLTSITIPSSVTTIDNAFYGSDNLTIHGVAGSYAETYAKENNIPFVADGSAAPVQSSAPASPTKFTDVAASSPFVDAINWAVEKNITTGKTDTTFAPGEECTNGQILTFLWRANGSPEPTVDNPFTDSIPASFQKAAVWAYEKGLVSGAVFGTSTPCTRAVTVEYLWKAAGSPVTAENASFSDVPANADYAQAVAWAVENGVTSGTGNGQFSPDNTCTRGQIVTFLYRAMGK